MPIENFTVSDEGESISSKALVEKIGDTTLYTPITTQDIAELLDIIDPALQEDYQQLQELMKTQIIIDRCNFVDEDIVVEKTNICKIQKNPTPTQAEIIKQSGVDVSNLLPKPINAECTEQYLADLTKIIAQTNLDAAKVTQIVNGSKDTTLLYYYDLLSLLCTLYSAAPRLNNSLVRKLNDFQTAINALSLNYKNSNTEKGFLLSHITKIINHINGFSLASGGDLYKNLDDKLKEFAFVDTFSTESNGVIRFTEVLNPDSGVLYDYLSSFNRTQAGEENNDVTLYTTNIANDRQRFLSTNMNVFVNQLIGVCKSNSGTYLGSVGGFSPSRLLDVLTNLINSFSQTTISFLTDIDFVDQMQDVDLSIKKISNVKACGLTVDVNPPEKDFNENLSAQVTAYKYESDITLLTYWQKYAKEITKINLLPNYWTIGLLIPTPNGVIRVPLPTKWVALATFYIPGINVLNVIFLTINGVFVAPVLYQIRYIPTSDAESVFLSVIKGFNKSIKMKTGNKILKLPVIKGVNIDPVLGQKLPFIQDDVPCIERLVAYKNLPYTNYLRQFLDIATPNMGF